jgi:hypothetical protein
MYTTMIYTEYPDTEHHPPSPWMFECVYEEVREYVQYGDEQGYGMRYMQYIHGFLKQQVCNRI